MSKNKKQAITLEQLDDIAKGKLVEISGWYGGTILVRLRPVDMTSELLEAQDILPNSLKKEAQEVFEGKKEPSEELKGAITKDNTDKKLMKKLEIVAKLALVEPTYEEITKRVPLLAQQKLEIWAWVMGGIDGLKSFREKSERNGGVSDNSKELRKEA